MPLDVRSAVAEEHREILTEDALAFVEELEARFGARRRELIESCR